MPKKEKLYIMIKKQFKANTKWNIKIKNHY